MGGKLPRFSVVVLHTRDNLFIGDTNTFDAFRVAVVINPNEFAMMIEFEPHNIGVWMLKNFPPDALGVDTSFDSRELADSVAGQLFNKYAAERSATRDPFGAIVFIDGSAYNFPRQNG